METSWPSPLNELFALSCKYLTYKEWKLKEGVMEGTATISPVSTLPIRNGNDSGL